MENISDLAIIQRNKTKSILRELLAVDTFGYEGDLVGEFVDCIITTVILEIAATQQEAGK